MSVTLTITKNKLAYLTIERPDVHNAFDSDTIVSLTKQLEHVSTLDVRALVLQSDGKHFSAGADLNWMRAMVNNDLAENIADSMTLATLMKTLSEVPFPTIAKVQGAAFGGALGLIACCDIAIAAENAKFCLSEVKLGLIPAVISPYVIRAIGERQARRYFLTAEIFDATTAQNIGLVHQIATDIEHTTNEVVATLLNNGPHALVKAKSLINNVANQAINDELIAYTAEQIATIRVSKEGQEGLAAFFEKRAPNWQQGANHD
jgi:methylglutaconyl-CoA hydratase